MKKFLTTASIAALGLSMPFTAQAGNFDDLSVSVSVDYVSEYVFRGVSFSRGAVQPGIEVSTNGFTAGVWSSAALGEASAIAADEIDVYAGYSWDLFDNVSADVGATIFHFPDTDGSLFDFGDASTFEVYGGLSFSTLLDPTIYAYYDVDLEAFTLEGGVSYSYPVAEKTSLDFGLTAGLVTGGDDVFDYEYGLGTVALSYGFTDDVSAYIGANYSLSSEDTLNFRRFTDQNGDDFASVTDDNLFWTGIGLAAGF